MNKVAPDLLALLKKPMTHERESIWSDGLSTDTNFSTFDEDTPVDFVVVLDRAIRKSYKIEYALKFINYLQERGLIFEVEEGQIPENIYVKISLTPVALAHFAALYNVDVSAKRRMQLQTRKPWLQFMATPLSYREHALWNSSKVTSMERIIIVSAVLGDAKFDEGGARSDLMQGLSKMTRMGIVKAAYPLHDGTHEFDANSPMSELSERQLLKKYWANFGHFYKEQPLNHIERYFGTEVAFYFAWLGFYNTMLIPASIVGTVIFFIALAKLFIVKHGMTEETCSSNLTLCPICYGRDRCVFPKVKSSCGTARLSQLFDNELIVLFAIFMSFWATVYRNLWMRYENELKARWHVEFVDADTKIRVAYKEKAQYARISRYTGQLVPYIAKTTQCYLYFISYGICCLSVVAVILAVFGVIMYRILLTAVFTLYCKEVIQEGHSTLITMTTGAVIQVMFIKLFGRWYAVLSESLTRLECPRTQTEFDNVVVHKRYFLGFANNYASLIYIAFVKGRFYFPARKTKLGSFSTDTCPPAGCLMSLCIQLGFHMFLKSMMGNILTLVVPLITSRFKDKRPEDYGSAVEGDFFLEPSGRYVLTTEYMEMIIQYGFVTFFVTAFPLAPLCAFLNNLMELRLDAFKFVTRHRRPVPKRQSGIGPWNDIVKVVTSISVATNAFVLAFTSDYVLQTIYKLEHHWDLQGYLKWSLSLFDLHDQRLISDVKTAPVRYCHYRASRFSHDHPLKYKLTPHFWYELGMRLVCVVCFEHIIWILTGLLSYFIPDMPQSVKETLNQERTMMQDHKMAMFQDEVSEHQVAPHVKLQKKEQ